MLRRDAYDADWSATKNLLAYNAKGSDGAYHIYTAASDGANPVQLGVGSASFPQRSTGTPVWSPSGRFIAFVAKKQARTPSLSNVHTVSPSDDAFNETGGFSADSASLVFTSDFETHTFWTSQIYRFDVDSHAITRLTRGESYNEHPRYTPDGQVLWMTNADNPSHGTDWWTMNPDGSNPQRLSDFNVGDSAKSIGHKPLYATVVQTANWNSDLSTFYGDVETSLLTSDSVIVRAALTCHGP